MKKQSVIVEDYRKYNLYYSMKDKDDIVYYPQVLLEQCAYRSFSNNVLIHPDLIFTDTEPDSKSEEEEINENTE